MPACQSQNLPELLADAEAVYRDLPVQSPLPGEATTTPRTSDLALRIMELYADVAGQAVAEQLGLVDLDDPVGHAVISAMFDTNTSQLAQDVVTRLFDVGLRLNRTSNTTAMSQVDDLIRNIRVIVLNRATDD